MVRRALVLALGCVCAAPVAAQTAPGQNLGVTLNTVQTQGAACRLTFVAQNGLGRDLDTLVLETVLFTRAGQVAQFTLFDFGALPDARTRVRQFDVPGLACADLGQVLFNGVAGCAGGGIDPAACAAALRPHSDIDVEVTG